MREHVEWTVVVDVADGCVLCGEPRAEGEAVCRDHLVEICEFCFHIHDTGTRCLGPDGGPA